MRAARQNFPVGHLRKVTPTCCADENGEQPSAVNIAIGDVIHLNSGGPDMTVVDMDAERIVGAWATQGQVYECTFLIETIHRKKF